MKVLQQRGSKKQKQTIEILESSRKNAKYSRMRVREKKKQRRFEVKKNKTMKRLWNREEKKEELGFGGFGFELSVIFFLFQYKN